MNFDHVVEFDVVVYGVPSTWIKISISARGVRALEFHPWFSFDPDLRYIGSVPMGRTVVWNCSLFSCTIFVGSQSATRRGLFELSPP